MIPINEEFSLQHSADSWTLHQHYMAKPKKPGDAPKETTKRTYHATIQQACRALIDKSLADVPRARKMMAKMEDLESILVEYIDAKRKEME